MNVKRPLALAVSDPILDLLLECGLPTWSVTLTFGRKPVPVIVMMPPRMISGGFTVSLATLVLLPAKPVSPSALITATRPMELLKILYMAVL